MEGVVTLLLVPSEERQLTRSIVHVRPLTRSKRQQRVEGPGDVWSWRVPCVYVVASVAPAALAWSLCCFFKPANNLKTKCDEKGSRGWRDR